MRVELSWLPAIESELILQEQREGGKVGAVLAVFKGPTE